MGGQSHQGRVCHSFPQPTSSFSGSHGVPIISGESREVSFTGTRSPVSPGKGGHRRSDRQVTRVLQSSVSGREELWRLETSVGCLQAQQICDPHQVFYGGYAVSPGFHPSGRLDDFSRYARRVFSYSHSSNISQISEVCVRWESVPVQGTLFWAEHCSSSLYQNLSPSSQVGTSCWYPDAALLGRLASSSGVFAGYSEGQRFHFRPLQQTGYSHQLSEVRPCSLSSQSISGAQDRFQPFLGFSYREASEQSSVNCRKISILRAAASQSLVATSGTHVLFGTLHFRGSSTNEGHSVSLEGTLAKEQGLGQSAFTHFRQYEEGTTLVGGPTQSSTGHLAPETEPGAESVFRRLNKGVGGGHELSSCIRPMVKRREQAPYQQLGAFGHLESSQEPSSFGPIQDSGGVLRQSDGPVLHQETRGHKILALVSFGERTPVVDRGEQHLPDTSICPRSAKCFSGSVEQEEPSNKYGMDSLSSSMQSSVGPVGSSLCRPVCDLSEPSSAQVCGSPYRSGGLGSRRHAVGLVQLGPLCLPSVCNSKASSQQIQGLPESQDDPNSSILASKRMVPGSVRSVSRCTQTSSSKAKSTQTAFVGPSTSKPPRSKPDRLETLHSVARAKGLSGIVRGRLVKAKRVSTNNLYQRQWAVYWRWCRDKGLSATRTSVNNICEFIIFLAEKKKLSVGVLKGYRSMLSTILRHQDFDLASNKDITEVIRSYQIELPNRTRKIEWNLDVVLKYLVSRKFEPLSESSLEYLTKKTLFLLALATAHRVSELQAVSRKVGFSREGAVISFLHSFRAKNDTKCKALPRHYLVKSLQDLVGNEEEALLCPVRAIRVYLVRTKVLVNNAHCNLFCSVRSPDHPMSKNGISFLIRQLIKEAHAELHEDFCPPLKVRAHDVRAVSTSFNFFKNLSLDDVIKAAMWRCRSLFASHYLKDVEIVYEDCCALGPLVTAGSIVT